MTVIPFDPTRARRLRPTGGSDAAAPAGLGGAGPRPGSGLTAPDGPRQRIEMLEQALLSALRENATNWARAERAETLLAAGKPSMMRRAESAG